MDSRGDVDVSPTEAPNNLCFDLRTLSTTAQPLSPTGLNGTFGGRVLSFISGPAKGFSARIAADAFTPGATLRFRIPATSINGDIITSLNGLAGSEVIINGRDFSGGTNRLGLVDSEARLLNLVAVSYTHLTLPTILLV